MNDSELIRFLQNQKGGKEICGCKETTSENLLTIATEYIAISSPRPPKESRIWTLLRKFSVFSNLLTLPIKCFSLVKKSKQQQEKNKDEMYRNGDNKKHQVCGSVRASS